MLSEILSKINTSKETYGLTADFAEVTKSENPNGLLEVKMLQRIGVYDDVLYISSQKPAKGKQGVVIFVGKQKYPVFVPLNFNTTQKSGTVKIAVTENVSVSNLITDVSKFEQMDATFPYFNFNGGSPPEQRYVMPEAHASLKAIAQQWYFSALNPERKKLYMGDGALKNGAKFHASHDSGLDVDVFVDANASNIESVYSFEQITEILRIMKSNSVVSIFFDPVDRAKYEQVIPSFVRKAYKGENTKHKDHFHLNYT